MPRATAHGTPTRALADALRDTTVHPTSTADRDAHAIHAALTAAGWHIVPAPTPDPSRPTWLTNGTRITHPTYGPGTIAANAWTPTDGYTARINWDNNWAADHWGADRWVNADSLTPQPPTVTPGGVDGP